MEVWEAVRTEREELAGLLEELSPDDWDVQSLCSEWTVRDVAAHVAAGAAGAFTLGPVLRGMLASGFNFNRYMAKDAKRRAAAPAAEIVRVLRENAASQFRTPGTKPVTVLSDVLTHAQDIRRPLNRPRHVRPDQLRAVADYYKGLGFGLGVKKRIAGLWLRATDLDWSTGTGPEVTGPGEALVMVMAGRREALEDLTGVGKDVLAARF